MFFQNSFSMIRYLSQFQLVSWIDVHFKISYRKKVFREEDLFLSCGLE